MIHHAIIIMKHVALSGKKKKSMKPCPVVIVELVKHKINNRTACVNVCLSVWWRSPISPQASTQEEEEAERSLYFVMSVFLSHFHKTCTGEGKAFQ